VPNRVEWARSARLSGGGLIDQPGDCSPRPGTPKDKGVAPMTGVWPPTDAMAGVELVKPKAINPCFARSPLMVAARCGIIGMVNSHGSNTGLVACWHVSRECLVNCGMGKALPGIDSAKLCEALVWISVHLPRFDMVAIELKPVESMSVGPAQFGIGPTCSRPPKYWSRNIRNRRCC
jgi:hypothetical protein